MPLSHFHLAACLLASLGALIPLTIATPTEIPVPAFTTRHCSGSLRVVKGSRIVGCLKNGAEYLPLPAAGSSEGTSCGKYTVGVVGKGKDADVVVVNVAKKTEFCYLTKGARVLKCGPRTQVPARAQQLAFDSSELYASEFQWSADFVWGYLRDRATEYEPGFMLHTGDEDGVTRVATAVASASPEYRIVCHEE
ncbi:MAG: hypothetical protein M1829_001273 [Trizodia sp. TS-e1964]|nr:MAG: hypothetical protein M1829_001273 [Trizodia sp. TS-e1964]